MLANVTASEALDHKEPGEYVADARALAASGEHSRADADIEEAQHRFPDHVGVFMVWAEIAAQRGAWPEAARRWEKVRTRFPNNPFGYVGGARALINAGRDNEAEAVIEDMLHRFPNDPGGMETWAELANRRRDWQASAVRWGAFRSTFPGQLTGYLREAAALRELRQFDESEAVIQAATERFPNETVLIRELAFLTHVRRDLPRALDLWRLFRERAPDQIAGFAFAALDLKYLGRFAEADEMLLAARERFPDHPAPLLDAARMSMERQDWPEARRRYHELRTRFPNELEAYTVGAIVARECGDPEAADELLKAAIARFPTHIAPLIDYARMARGRLDGSELLARWALVRERFPESPEGYLGGADALRVMQRVDEADALLAEAEVKLPSVPRFAVDRAWLAFHRHDWSLAGPRFAAIRMRFPDEPAGYLGGAAALSSQGKIGEAESLLEAGMRRLPSDPGIALEHAQLPIAGFLRDRRNWPEAIRRLESLCARFPLFELGHLIAVRVRRDAGRLDEAEALAADAKRRMPKNIGIAVEHARLAFARGAWDEAVARFTQVKECFLDVAEGYVGLAESLSRLSRFDEAEEILRAAILRFPSNPEAFKEYARLATRRNDLRGALERWIDTEKRFPNDPQLPQLVFEARLRLTEIDDTDDAPAVRSDESAASLTPTEMIQEFESLGGTHLGCEFGLVQRALGAEPLGLLRWTDMSYENIVSALEARFDGVGLPENTELIIPEKDGRAEYGTRDRRFGMRMHTFVARDDAPADKLFTQLCRRLRFLSSKLIDDLSNNTKLFVFKITLRNLTMPELVRLRTAMQAYGENTLLYVCYADAEHKPETVEIVARGLIVGYVDHFAMGPAEENLGPVTSAWTAICTKAHALWRSGAAMDPHLPELPAPSGNPLPSVQVTEQASVRAGPAMDAAAAALAAGDLSTAHAKWREARGCEDAPASAWLLAAANSLTDDPAALLQQALERFPDDPKALHDLGRAFEKLKDPASAETCWRGYIAKGGTQWWAFAALASALRAQGQEADASAVLRDARAKLPDEPQIIAEAARVAEQRRDWDDAIAIWDEIIARFPGKWVGFRGKVGALEKSGQPDLAGKLIDEHAPLLPNDIDALHDLARFAEKKRDWPRAENAWRSFLELDQRHLWAYIALAGAVREQSRYAEAEAILRDAASRFPNRTEIHVEAARCADLRGDAATAALNWQAIGTLRPKSPEGPLGEADLLRRHGQIDAADAVVLAATKRLPDEPALLEAYGLNAMARNAWAEALSRLEAAERRFPSHGGIRRRIFEARLRVADEAGGTAPQAVEEKRDAGERSLVMQFESLGGGGHGCEFGIFQRFYGAEPLGLLRWADIYQDRLAEVLETEFVGIGSPEFTNVFVPGHGEEAEYWTTDNRYHMAMRSFVRVADVPIERMRQQVTKRFQFLSRKLADDLRAGTKIFVYKNMKRNLTDEELRRLHAACRRYGKNTLLYIRYEDADHPNGTVTVEGDGLMIGYIDHFSHTPDTDAYIGPANESLLALCKTAFALWSAGKAGSEPDRLSA